MPDAPESARVTVFSGGCGICMGRIVACLRPLRQARKCSDWRKTRVFNIGGAVLGRGQKKLHPQNSDTRLCRAHTLKASMRVKKAGHYLPGITLSTALRHRIPPSTCAGGIINQHMWTSIDRGGNHCHVVPSHGFEGNPWRTYKGCFGVGFP